jgi:hypothetical protein
MGIQPLQLAFLSNLFLAEPWLILNNRSLYKVMEMGIPVVLSSKGSA